MARESPAVRPAPQPDRVPRPDRRVRERRGEIPRSGETPIPVRAANGSGEVRRRARRSVADAGEEDAETETAELDEPGGRSEGETVSHRTQRRKIDQLARSRGG